MEDPPSNGRKAIEAFARSLEGVASLRLNPEAAESLAALLEAARAHVQPDSDFADRLRILFDGIYADAAQFRLDPEAVAGLVAAVSAVETARFELDAEAKEALDRILESTSAASRQFDGFWTGETPTSGGDADDVLWVDLLSRVVERLGTTIEAWAKNNHFGRTTIFDWRRAGGKPLKGKVSKAKSAEIISKIEDDARKLGLALGPART